MAAPPHGPRLAERSLLWLFRSHVSCLLCLAPATPGGAHAALLERLQALTPDRVPNFEAAVYGPVGQPPMAHELEDLSQGAIGRPKIKVAFSIGPCANWQGH